MEVRRCSWTITRIQVMTRPINFLLIRNICETITMICLGYSPRKFCSLLVSRTKDHPFLTTPIPVLSRQTLQNMHFRKKYIYISFILQEVQKTNLYIQVYGHFFPRHIHSYRYSCNDPVHLHKWMFFHICLTSVFRTR